MSSPLRADDPRSDPAGGYFSVATSDEVVYARVVGLGSMANSFSLKQFLDRCQKHNYQKFVVDLSECDGFDSTFMGVLLGLALAEATVVIINASDDHRRLLSEVGIHRLVELCSGPIPLPEIPLTRLEEKAFPAEARMRVILAAHEDLTRIDERNAERFGAFLEALRAELGGKSRL